MEEYKILFAILVMFAVTFTLTAIPFYSLHRFKDHPFILYLSRMMPACVVAILVIFSYMNLWYLEFPYGIPEIIAGLSVIAIHFMFKNMLLSIGIGLIIFRILLILFE